MTSLTLHNGRVAVTNSNTHVVPAQKRTGGVLKQLSALRAYWRSELEPYSSK